MASTTGQKTSPWTPPPKGATSPPASIGSTLGAIAIAVGVGMLGYYMLDGHAHTCEACGQRWRHLGVFNHGDPTSHTCKCGTVQWWKDGVPHVFREAVRQPPPKLLPDSLVARLREIGEAPRLALATSSPLETWAKRAQNAR